MSDIFKPTPVEAIHEKTPEQAKKWDFQIDEKGELRIEGMGDINNPYNEDARSPDEEMGMSKIDRWLETEQDEKGRYTKARFIDEDAYRRNQMELLRRGRAISEKLKGQNVKRLITNRFAKKESETAVTLESFSQILSDYIDADPEMRSQIISWDLKQLKSRKDLDAQFRLTVIFENELARGGKKKKNFVGSYAEVTGRLDKELDRLAAPLKAVDI